MTSLPLSFRVRNAVVEKHQLEGMDPSDRYFNRMIPIKRVERGYSGTVMYEALNVQSQVYPTVQEVLRDISDQLRELGFTILEAKNIWPKKKPGLIISTPNSSVQNSNSPLFALFLTPAISPSNQYFSSSLT